MKVFRSLLFSLLALSWFSAVAQNPSTGVVGGRVSNEALGTYLSNARVTIGNSLETFTDPFGNYRLTGVPAGEARVRVFYTGFPVQERVVTIRAAQSVTQDFALSTAGRSDPDAPVKLDSFVVAASRDLTAAALAVNEQRFTRLQTAKAEHVAPHREIRFG